MLDRIWHLKSTSFDNTIFWKIEQEKNMFNEKGTSLTGGKLNDFIRMIQSAIPQDSFSLLKADTVVDINKYRRIVNLYTDNYIF